MGELQSALDALVRNGRALEKLPAVAAGCSEGVITAEQVAVVAEVATPENVERAAEQGVDLGEVDAVLAEAAATGQHAQLGRVVAHYLARFDPDGIEPDPTDGRSLSLARHGGGSITGRFELDPVGGRSCRPRSNRSCRPPGPRATCGPAPPLGDGLVQLADKRAGVGSAAGAAHDQAAADHHHPAGRPGRSRHRPGRREHRVRRDPVRRPHPVGGLRRLVEQRDRHCVFAGCAAPSHWCDVHHLLEWVLDDGETSLENSALLCERHHTKVHHGFRVERPPDGRWRTYRPDGTQILIPPPL